VEKERDETTRHIPPPPIEATGSQRGVDRSRSLTGIHGSTAEVFGTVGTTLDVARSDATTDRLTGQSSVVGRLPFLPHDEQTNAHTSVSANNRIVDTLPFV
jgi:hypothetical protein